MTPPHTLPAPADGMLRARRPTGVVMALVVIALAFAAQSIPAIGLMVGDSIASESPSGAAPSEALAIALTRTELVVTLLSFGLGTGVLWLWVRAKERRPFASLGFAQRSQAPRLVLRGAAIGLAMLLASLSVPLLTGQAQLRWAAPSWAATLFIAAMLAAFLVQGSSEEILTRGFLTQAVARRWGLGAAVAAQAVVFMLLHGANPGMGALPIINLLLFACFASLLSLAEGSLWGICAMHGVWNWAQGNVFGVAVSGGSTADSLFTTTAAEGSNPFVTGGSFGVEGSLVTTAVYLIGIAIAWRAFRKTTPV